MNNRLVSVFNLYKYCIYVVKKVNTLHRLLGVLNIQGIDQSI